MPPFFPVSFSIPFRSSDFFRFLCKQTSPLSQLEFVLHKTTIALKFMSYINSDLNYDKY